MTPVPALGCIVLYVGPDSILRSAIVVRVCSDTMVNLFVFPRDAGDFCSAGPIEVSVHYAPADAPRLSTWHWLSDMPPAQAHG